MKVALAVVFSLLLTTPSLIDADFVFEFEVVAYTTNGNCLGIDFTIPCETFVDDFCLRGSAYYNSVNDDSSLCSLGENREAVYPTPQTRSIESNQPWQGQFQLYIRAYDDDFPLTYHDHLDNIFINRIGVLSTQYTQVTTFPGVRNKVSVSLKYRIYCKANYYGSDCSTNCVPNDDDTNGHYTCNPVDGSVICREGFINPETNCIDPSACRSSPCQQEAHCTFIPLNDFTCSCPSGYTGKMCELEVDECQPNPCSNSGNCTDMIADYLCTCLPGYSGKNCTENIDECLGVVCAGNASCTDGVNEYTCVCTDGFEGPNCTASACRSSPCQQEAHCTSIPLNNFTCSCPSGYTGKMCELEVDECQPNPCSNSGNCTDMIADYLCTCLPGYSGKNCTENIDECLGVVCAGNASCTDGVNEYTCVCTDGFEGPNCTVGSQVGSQGAVVGVAISCLLVLIILIVIVILIVVVVLTKSRHRKTYTVPVVNQERDNSYEYHPTSPTSTMQSTDALFNNPLYALPTSILEHKPNPDISILTNQAYSPSPVHSSRDVNNPLYGDSLIPTHVNGGPIYSEPVHNSHATTPPKGSENYPYSYAIVDQNRLNTFKDASRVTTQNFSPNYEQASPTLKPGGPQYEEVVFKDEPGIIGGSSKFDSNRYATPNPVSQSEPSQGSLVYHYATGESTRVTGIKTNPLLGAAVAKSREGPLKKTIYDSQDDSELASEMTQSVAPSNDSKPAPPPRSKPAVPMKPDVYSYAITHSSSGKRSVKLNHESESVVSSDGQMLPSYNKLEHDMGPGAPGHQVRMAKIEGSGYEPLKREM